VEAHQLLAEPTPLEHPSRATSSGGARDLAVRCARRALDVVGAMVALIVLAPVMAVTAVAIVLTSPGPVIFRQPRLGRGMREFTLLKFRTMHSDADSALHREYTRRLISGDDSPAEDGLYKLCGDPRVTRVGGVLRGWSLDEVPQLLNVLRGHMSLVGPRPVLAYEADEYPDWYLRRFAVKPGMTGLWQVSGRNERTYEEMVRLDVEYVHRRTLALDIKILIKTVWVVLRRKGVA
jgi:lipopolysaccharide/colanic/teichoic acid biosynthesis glycosyltransferase